MNSRRPLGDPMSPRDLVARSVSQARAWRRTGDREGAAHAMRLARALKGAAVRLRSYD